MNNIVLCDSTRSLLIKCNIESAKLEAVPLGNYGKPCAPHDLTISEQNIYVANSIDDTISIISKSTFREMDCVYAGSTPEDVLLVDNYVFVACGGTNSVNVLDKNELKLLVTIPVKNFPHCLAYDSGTNRIFVANFNGSSISIIDVKTLNEEGTIKSKYYPTKIIVEQKYNMLICCESCLGDKNGYIEFFSLSDFRSIKRVEVGKNPIDICTDEEKVYISSFGEGIVSIINLDSLELEGNIFIGGNLRGLCRVDKYLCIGDKKNLSLIICDLERGIKKVIALGGEPNAIEVLL